MCPWFETLELTVKFQPKHFTVRCRSNQFECMVNWTITSTLTTHLPPLLCEYIWLLHLFSGQPHMQKLVKPIICNECSVIFTEVPVEEFADSPVHCRECGAFICLWRDIIAFPQTTMGTHQPN
ncbi:hypothetical protein QFZ34_001280 [Phyllobacterium ifriqiyense]|uniref:Uncharacterized protein n=1 Tax=Phyllobacterium ifriqiyense TaxID=314238 RepID=A0ABU0S5R5_9HYPH|nr:hypothetical protein [Phyllobacterium ifriqiyense]